MRPTGGLRTWPVLLFMLALFVGSLVAPQEWAKVTMVPIAKLVGSKDRGHVIGTRVARPVSDRVDTRPENPAEASPSETSLAVAPAEQAAPAEPASSATLATPSDLATNDASSEIPAEPLAETVATVDPLPVATLGPPSAAPASDIPLAAWPPNTGSNAFQELVLSPQDVCPLISPQGDAVETDLPPSEALSALEQYAQPKDFVEVAPPVAEQVAPTAPPTSPTAPLPEQIGALAPNSPGPTRSLDPESSPVIEASPDAESPAPSLERRTLSPRTDLVAHWPYPAEIARRLQTLGARESYAKCCAEIDDQLRQLHAVEALASPAAAACLRRLAELAKQAAEYGVRSDDLSDRAEWQRVAHGLTRRLAIWNQVSAIASQTVEPIATGTHEVTDLTAALAAVERRLEASANARKWRDYLMLTDAQQSLSADRPFTDESRALVKRILLRIDFASLTPREEAFLKQPELAAYATALRHLVLEPVSYLALLDALERYETELEPASALQAATAQQALRWSENPAVLELSRQMDAYYRNANVRIAVSSQLIQRLLPGPERTSVGVNDVIMGAHTVGVSEALTQLQVRLVPSPRTWRFDLEANGNVASQTSSHKGSATFYSAGNSVFRAQKEITVNTQGVRHTPAAAAAASASDLTGLETALDPVPILGDIARNIASKQYLSRSDAARSEMQDKIAWQAGQRFDTTVEERLQEVREQFVAHFYQPTRKLALNPTVLDMQTTQDRMVVRYRLAGFHQLAAHTPRPQAPTSSMLSVQLHESAVNNLLDQLGWAGREASFQQLAKELAQLFHRPSVTLPEDLPDDVTVRFAAGQPLHVAFQEGHVCLTLTLAELAQGRNRWRDFTVRVRYLPAPEDTGADLVRDEYVELAGKRLPFRDQVALRAIFSRVFPRNQPIDVISQRLRSDRRLQGLEVTQITIDDGWIGLAVGKHGSAKIARQTQPVRR